MSIILIPIVIIETIAIVVLLAALASVKAQTNQLKKDNRELLRRLRLVSRSKIVD